MDERVWTEKGGKGEQEGRMGGANGKREDGNIMFCDMHILFGVRGDVLPANVINTNLVMFSFLLQLDCTLLLELYIKPIY